MTLRPTVRVPEPFSPTKAERRKSIPKAPSTPNRAYILLPSPVKPPSTPGYHPYPQDKRRRPMVEAREDGDVGDADDASLMDVDSEAAGRGQHSVEAVSGMKDLPAGRDLTQRNRARPWTSTRQRYAEA